MCKQGKERNPLTMRCNKKCKPTYVRNATFKCVKNQIKKTKKKKQIPAFKRLEHAILTLAYDDIDTDEYDEFINDFAEVLREGVATKSVVKKARKLLQGLVYKNDVIFLLLSYLDEYEKKGFRPLNIVV